MAYNNNVPLGNQTIASTTSVINANFMALTSWGNGYGEYVLQGSTPSFSTNNDGLYTATYGTTSTNELFIHKQSFAGTQEIPLSSSILSTSTPSLGAQGWTYLPSGIILRWENFTGNGLTTVTLTGSTYPAFTQILTVIVSPFSSSTSDANFAVRLVSILNTTQFNVYFSSRTSTGAAAGGAQVLIIGY